jgi:hypothetical protein
LKQAFEFLSQKGYLSFLEETRPSKGALDSLVVAAEALVELELLAFSLNLTDQQVHHSWAVFGYKKRRGDHDTFRLAIERVPDGYSI